MLSISNEISEKKNDQPIHLLQIKIQKKTQMSHYDSEYLILFLGK